MESRDIGRTDKLLKNMEKDGFMINMILSKLEEYKDGYDLGGVELTREDAENVIDLINDGYTEDNAIDTILNGINDVLSDGWGD